MLSHLKTEIVCRFTKGGVRGIARFGLNWRKKCYFLFSCFRACRSFISNKNVHRKKPEIVWRFAKVPKFIKKGGQKGLKTLIRPYIFRKIFTKFPSSEKIPHIVPKFTKFPTSKGWEFFPSFPMFKF